LGGGDDDGLKDDKEHSNKETYKKDKEQGQNKLARIHSLRCPSLQADTPKPNIWLRQEHGSRKISSPPCFKVGKIGASAPAKLNLDPRLLQGTKMRKSKEELGPIQDNMRGTL
jgi:hypothetical protein